MRQPAGHMPGASSTTSIWRMLHRPPLKHSGIGALYAIEDEIRGKPVDLRLSARQTRARPLLDDLRNGWRGTSHLSSKSETAAAIRYASHAGGPSRYTEDGLLESTTAPLKGAQSCRLGRKTLRRSDCGGERAAAMYTLIRLGQTQTDSIRNSTSAPCWRRSLIIASAT